jgi:uncharacterized SAM-binding protein YcdF (DUF218 family)
MLFSRPMRFGGLTASYKIRDRTYAIQVPRFRGLARGYMDLILFIAKKVFSVFIYPLGFSLLLWFFGIFSWFKKRSKTAWGFILVGGVLLAAASNPYVSGLLIKQLEDKAGAYADPASPDKIDVKYIVVLAGDERPGDLTASDRLAASTLVRMMEALRLRKGMPGAKLVLSGGTVDRRIMPSADAMNIFALEQGVPKESIILERDSLDTADEADLLKDVLAGSPFILVTSASHMPRSLMIFRRLGLKPIPAPADFEVKELIFTFRSAFPKAGALEQSTRAVHEYFGIGLVMLKNYVSPRISESGKKQSQP